MFTPIETTIGALLLHQATSNLLYQNGDTLGVSGFLRKFFSTPTKETLAVFVGMAASYYPLKTLAPQLITTFPPLQITIQAASATIAVGALVGWGTKTSNGCTSGHMLCGLSKQSTYSASAVATFFPAALITHHLVHPTLQTSACPGDRPCYTPVYPSLEKTTSIVVLAVLSVFAAQAVPRLIAKFTTPPHTAASDDGKQLPTTDPHPVAPRIATAFFSGLLFALGLHISQMAHPAKVTSFLSFPVMHYWDPSLVLVILFGVLPNLVQNKLQGFKSPPLFADKFALSPRTFKDVDTKFILGAAAFGVGWGLTGTCPGPAVLRALSQPIWGVLWMGGFWLGGRLIVEEYRGCGG
ncbi:YeeE/YedE family integral membrane protein-like protein [Clathrospora elynae]|uniref:YeeE/YedE family integral membrane protein-like protein n=1 Tax=Clathrospora elynae TaxID=706981 RepID=A0A6A5T537_9PLEO|nr:YeeE/YedE family integral membrane protein-like protein [Clathrospora elynae]